MTASLDAAFGLVAPATYWVIVVLWTIILALLIKKASAVTAANRVLKILVVVLAIDAFRTLFENLYFGVFFNAYYGLFPKNLRSLVDSPTLLALPKIFNIAAGLVVLFLLIRRWFPLAELERAELLQRERDNAHRMYAGQLEKERSSLLIAQAVAKVGSWETDLQTFKIVWSAETFRIFEIDPGSFAGTHEHFLALVHPDDRAAVDEAFRKSFGTPEVCTIEHRALMRDGRIKFIVERWQTYVGVDGKPARAVGTSQDITDLRQAQRTAQESANLLRVAGRAARLGGWVVRIDEGRVIWSDETAALHDEPSTFSPTVEDAIKYYAPECRQKIEEAFFKCARDGTAFNETLELVSAKGRRFWARATGEAVRDAAGTINAVHGSFQDVTELVTVREESQRLSNRLTEMLDNIHDAFATFDEDARFSFVNRKAMMILQRNDLDLIGKVVWEAFPDLVGSIFEKQYKQAVDTQKSVSFTASFAPVGRWFSVNVSPAGNGVAVYFRDVTTARTQTEQLALLEAAISRINDIVMITEAEPIDDPGPRIVYVNDAFTKSTGYSREEIIGKTPRVLQGANTQRDELVRIREGLRAKRPVQAQLINYTKAGTEYWLELNIIPIIDQAGQCTHFVAVERDITERKAIEQALSESEQRFRTVAELTADIVWDWDLAEDTLWRNEAGMARFGAVGAVHIKSQAWKDCIHPEDRGRVLAGLHEARESAATKWSEEYRYLLADGSYAQVWARGSIIRNEAGKAIRIVGSTADVTKQRQLEEQLRQSQKLEAVGQLTGGVAHDFNNILMVIMANVDAVLEDDEARADPLPHLKRISGAAERATQLTRQLLAFSRKQTLRLQPTNLNDLVVDIGALLRRTLGEHIEIDSVLFDDLWQVDTDRAQVEAALVNLCVNARDAMPEGGRLIIETRNATLDQDYVAFNPDATLGDYVMLSVTDSGSGMSPEILARVFEPFFTTKGVGKGTGLGLSMVHGFVKQSKGHVSIHSEVGVGTAIKLYLPRSKQEKIVSRAESETRIPRGTECILVVEDDEAIRSIVAQQLVSLGYVVVQASSGLEGMALLQTGQSIDLLLTDVVMPGLLNGRGLADEAIKLRPDLRVLFMSGYSEDAISTMGVLNPGLNLLNKPFRKTDLAIAVRRALAGENL